MISLVFPMFHAAVRASVCLFLLLDFGLVSAQSARPAGQTNPQLWPNLAPVFAPDPQIEAAVKALINRMTLPEKVGQLIQADLGSVTPEQVRRFHLGSVLNSAETGPNNDSRAPLPAWLALADRFWAASTDRRDGRTGVPVLWGTDAVHGHNNIVGATVFPHNIGLGATRNPALIEAIGRVTAREIRITGLDWTFAPTVAVVRNDRWGRSYEGYSESPSLVGQYAARMVIGLQGRVGTPGFLTGDHVLATAKHFIGDGATDNGIDQGNNLLTETALRDLQSSGYVAAISAGVQFVMASFSSWHGQKMHGHEPLLTGVLRNRFHFQGVTVGDWNGHAHLPGCTVADCPRAINAGLDLFMVPQDWQQLHGKLLDNVRRGTLSLARLDEAVGRMLRVKMRAGLFDAGKPSQRPLAGQWELFGGPGHRAIARQAVRESLVLLKNQDQVLPVQPGKSVLITGDGADDIGRQSGGWTVNWQGGVGRNHDFPHGTSISDGLTQAITATGGSVIHLPRLPARLPAVELAIVVFGEDPYAEMKGDRPNVDFALAKPLQTLRRLKRAGIPTVSVFLSGRPLVVNDELAASDAFVAAWLPGVAGEGIADVLVADQHGAPRHDFTGRLSFSWPGKAGDTELNIGDRHYAPKFPFGFGLKYQP